MRVMKKVKIRYKLIVVNLVLDLIRMEIVLNNR